MIMRILGIQGMLAMSVEKLSKVKAPRPRQMLMKVVPQQMVTLVLNANVS